MKGVFMCNFYSCIVDKKLRILDAIDINDSHEATIDKYKLNDNKLEERDIVRLEVNPDIEKLTKTFDKKFWTYKVDEQKTLPSWYTENEKKIQKLVFDKLHDDIWQKYILVDKKIEQSTHRISVCKNSHIEKLIHDIGWMEGSSTVEVMRDSSTVEVMRDSSTVKWMRGSSTVKWMRGSSTVKAMEDSSTVEVMRDSSTVKAMEDSSTVEVMRDSSTVKWMRDSSTVKAMEDSSTVEVMRDSSTVKWMRDSSTVEWMEDSTQAITYNGMKFIKKQEGGKTVIIDRSGEKVKVKIG
jgi:hypothetical protein